jgi:hypothetical protein
MKEIIISLSCIVSIIAGLYYIGDKNSKELECIMLDERKSVVGRLNDKGDSECIYIPDTNGCYIISHPFENLQLQKKELDETCKKTIENYPSIVIDGKNTKGDIYTCGKNSTNEKLWSNTGYESEKDMCYKIREEKSIFSEIKKWLNMMQKRYIKL